MRAHRAVLSSIGLATLLGACGSSQPTPPPLKPAAAPAKPAVASTKLTGIVRSNRAALALVEAPDGIGYILKPGDTLGDGRLLEIGSDSVVFTVTSKAGAPTNRVVLKLATN